MPPPLPVDRFRGSEYALRARWVAPIAGEPLRDGVVEVRGGRIARVASKPASDLSPLDLNEHYQRDVALLPALVNAHTHLEFSQMRQPLGEPGMPFAEWIALVVPWRLANPIDYRLASAAGVQESLRYGVGTLGEIATSNWDDAAARDHEERPHAEVAQAAQDVASVVDGRAGRGEPPRWLAHGPVASVVFRELLGFPRSVVEERLDLARRFFAAACGTSTDSDRCWHGAVSPHAPYTVHQELAAGLVELAVRHGAPVAMHLAESPDEMELLATGQGRFREFLERLGLWDDTALPSGGRPLAYLELLARGPRALIAHGNYLQPDEWEFLSQRRERMTVVYCPRTHAYFRHSPYPLQEMLRRGVHLALGTDSRASSPDLNLWEDLVLAGRLHGVANRRLLQLATLDGAQALGLAARCGSLTAGKEADLCIAAPSAASAASRTATGAADDPCDWLFGDAAPQVLATIRRGGVVWPTPEFGA